MQASSESSHTHQPEASSSTASQPSAAGASDGSSSSGGFECNICFDSPTEPVITTCGHIFCWPCLYRWIEHNNQSTQLTCPVCKAGVTRESIIPIYGRGGSSSNSGSATSSRAAGSSSSSTDDGIPQRPRGHRPDPQPNPNYSPFGGAAPGFAGFAPFFGTPFHGTHSHAHPHQANRQFMDAFQLFNFPFFGGGFGFQTQFSFGAGTGTGAGVHAARGQQRENQDVVQQQQFLARLLFLMGVIILVAVLFS